MSPGLAQTLTEAFWQPSIWLPPNSTWSDIELPRKAQFGHLAYPLPMAFILMVVRFFLDRWLYRYSRHYRTEIAPCCLQDQLGQLSVWRTKRRGRPSRIQCWKQHSNAGNWTWNPCVPTPGCQTGRSVFGWGWEIMLESQYWFSLNSLILIRNI